MRMLRWLLVVIGLLVSMPVSANQVQEAPPPPPPPATSTPEPPPAYQSPPPPAPTSPAPTPGSPPANTAQTTASSGAQWQSTTTPASSGTGFETHDGFFLRLGLGFGWAFWGDDLNMDSIEVTGFALGIDIAIGAVITENLALHLSLFGSTVAEPEVSVDGEDRGTRENATLNGSGIGIGLTYFIMPANVYFSGAIGLGGARLTFNSGTTDEINIDTDTGYALEAMVGKEWWVSPQWGMGLAFQLVYVSVPDVDRRLMGTGAHVLFSVTYN